MNPFSSPTGRPTEIIITPVNNGWIVTLPEAHSPTELSSMIPEMIKGIKSALPGHENEIQDIIDKANANHPHPEVAPPPFTRDQNVHIFSTFDKVLAFLKVQIDE